MVHVGFGIHTFGWSLVTPLTPKRLPAHVTVSGGPVLVFVIVTV